MNPFPHTLIVITDRALAGDRSVIDVTAATLAAGARVVQLRDKHATPRDLCALADALLPLVRRHHGRLIVNDRIDVALATGADGAHLGPADMPIAAARSIVPPTFILGWSTDDPAAAVRAQADGADYIGCGAVFGSTTKDVGGERIGVNRLDAVARSVSIPVFGIGGIRVDNVDDIAATRAAGAAVVGAVMASSDPAAATRALLLAFERRSTHDTVQRDSRGGEEP